MLKTVKRKMGEREAAAEETEDEEKKEIIVSNEGVQDFK
jgi:hypothetical protein